MPIRYTDKDIEFIRQNRSTMTLKEIADELNYSLSNIGRICKHFEISIDKEAANKLRVKSMIGRTTSTPEIDAKLSEKYLEMPIKQLARYVGKSDCFVAHRLNQLGLVIPREIVEQRIQASRKKKGDIPFNKGMKQSEFMSAESIEKTKLTRFGPGNLPHNTLYDGAIKIRKSKGFNYQWIRVGLAQWDLLHRVIWRKHFGPIPKTHIIVFKDRNTLNCDISNLEMISMEENMLRNTIQNYPTEFKEVLRMQKKLERIINRKTCHKTN